MSSIHWSHMVVVVCLVWFLFCLFVFLFPSVQILTKSRILRDNEIEILSLIVDPTQGVSLHRTGEVDERREFAGWALPWPASDAVDHRFASADIVAFMNHSLHWKFNLMDFEAKYFKDFYVFLYLSKKLEHTSSPHGERFLCSSYQNTRVIWVFLSSFPDACCELMGLNRSNLLCWHFPPSNCTESAFADTLSSLSLKKLLFLR